MFYKVHVLGTIYFRFLHYLHFLPLKLTHALTFHKLMIANNATQLAFILMLIKTRHNTVVFYSIP